MSTTNTNEDIITTIFVVGFPDDMREREFQNLFLFANDFEGAVLKIPPTINPNHANGNSNNINSVINGSTSNNHLASSLVKSGQEHIVEEALVPHCADSASSSCSSLNNSISFSSSPNNPQSRKFSTASMNSTNGTHMTSSSTIQSQPKKQIIGFARFKTQTAAIRAIEVINGRKIDPDRCPLMMKAELAKKNLIPNFLNNGNKRISICIADYMPNHLQNNSYMSSYYQYGGGGSGHPYNSSYALNEPGNLAQNIPSFPYPSNNYMAARHNSLQFSPSFDPLFTNFAEDISYMANKSDASSYKTINGDLGSIDSCFMLDPNTVNFETTTHEHGNFSTSLPVGNLIGHSHSRSQSLVDFRNNMGIVNPLNFDYSEYHHNGSSSLALLNSTAEKKDNNARSNLEAEAKSHFNSGSKQENCLGNSNSSSMPHSVDPILTKSNDFVTEEPSSTSMNGLTAPIKPPNKSDATGMSSDSHPLPSNPTSVPCSSASGGKALFLTDSPLPLFNQKLHRMSMGSIGLQNGYSSILAQYASSTSPTFDPSIFTVHVPCSIEKEDSTAKSSNQAIPLTSNSVSCSPPPEFPNYIEALEDGIQSIVLRNEPSLHPIEVRDLASATHKAELNQYGGDNFIENHLHPMRNASLPHVFLQPTEYSNSNPNAPGSLVNGSSILGKSPAGLPINDNNKSNLIVVNGNGATPNLSAAGLYRNSINGNNHPIGENPPCNTLYVGNLPMSALEEELRNLFSKCPGYKRLSFKSKVNGPMCFVEFEDVVSATTAMNDLYGTLLSNSTKGGIRLSYSKNPLGVRPPGSLPKTLPHQYMNMSFPHNLNNSAMTPLMMNPLLANNSQVNGVSPPTTILNNMVLSGNNQSMMNAVNGHGPMPIFNQNTMSIGNPMIAPQLMTSMNHQHANISFNQMYGPNKAPSQINTSLPYNNALMNANNQIQTLNNFRNFSDQMTHHEGGIQNSMYVNKNSLDGSHTIPMSHSPYIPVKVGVKSMTPQASRANNENIHPHQPSSSYLDLFLQPNSKVPLSSVTISQMVPNNNNNNT